MSNEEFLAANECPFPNCIEPADVPHAHNTLYGQVQRTDWADEYLAASLVTDMAKDPDDYRRSVQSAVTIGGLLVPVSMEDRQALGYLFTVYEAAFQRTQRGLPFYFETLTATMLKMLTRSATRNTETPDFSYISIDPRDYSTFSCPGIGDLTVISIHTRPERCYFLGILRFDVALGLSLGRMRVMRPNENGMYPVTIRTKWRALTNKVKQEEVRDAYRRLIDPTR